MTRNGLFGLAGVLAALGTILLLSGLVLLNKDVRGHVSENYRQYSAATSTTTTPVTTTTTTATTTPVTATTTTITTTTRNSGIGNNDGDDDGDADGDEGSYSGVGDTRYECSGAPSAVADEIASFDPPEARASDRGSEYLRYPDQIIIVGPDGPYPCSVRVEDINSRYSAGGFIFLGPGFTPGSPASGSGGSPGGPDGTK